MDRLQFRIAGLDRRRVRRLPRPASNAAAPVLPLAAKALLLLPVVVVAAQGLLEPVPVEIAPGLPVRASRVIVLRDASGSMAEFVPQTDAAMERLRASGRWDGSFIPIGGSASGIPGVIESALTADPGADAIWMVSDFHDGSDLVGAGGDRVRFEMLVGRLRRNGIRLYLSTVSREPHPDYIEAVSRTGGSLHRFFPPSP